MEIWRATIHITMKKTIMSISCIRNRMKRMSLTKIMKMNSMKATSKVKKMKKIDLMIFRDKLSRMQDLKMVFTNNLQQSKNIKVNI